MLRNARKSYLLVAIQMAMLLLIALTGPWIARQPLWLLLEVLGLGLGIWAIGAMRLGNFNIVPDIKPASRLVRRGPYGWIRHPMYTALLLVALALVLEAFSLLRLLLWLILLADLLVKLHYEEALLTAHFADYAAYQQRTHRLLPGIY
jgi:protein-S-isoprenylcysteine O-methyltransferase Ste14